MNRVDDFTAVLRRGLLAWRNPMVIITWMQRGAKGAASYTMRAVIKPIAERDAEPYIVERAHTDATGGMGWVPARHTHTPAIVCKALLKLAAQPAPAVAASPCTIDLGCTTAAPTTIPPSRATRLGPFRC